MQKKKTTGSCESCAYYAYDEDYECYTCEMDLDEDELVRFLSLIHIFGYRGKRSPGSVLCPG